MFLDVRLSFRCLTLCNPPESWPRWKPSRSPTPRTEEQAACLCLLTPLQDMGLLFMALNLHPPVYIMDILLLKHLLFTLSTLLSGFLIPTTSSLLFPLSLLVSPSASFHVCAWRVFWNSLDMEELSNRWTFFFLSTEWKLATGICHSQFNLSSKLEGQRRVKYQRGKRCMFADLGQLSYLKCFLCCVWNSRSVMYTVDSAAPRERSLDVIQLICKQ